MKAYELLEQQIEVSEAIKAYHALIRKYDPTNKNNPSKMVHIKTLKVGDRVLSGKQNDPGFEIDHHHLHLIKKMLGEAFGERDAGREMRAGIDAGHHEGGGAPIPNKGIQVHHFVKGMNKPHVTSHSNLAAAHEHIHSMVNHGEMAEIHSNGVHSASITNVNGKMNHRVHGV